MPHIFLSIIAIVALLLVSICELISKHVKRFDHIKLIEKTVRYAGFLCFLVMLSLIVFEIRIGVWTPVDSVGVRIQEFEVVSSSVSRVLVMMEFPAATKNVSSFCTSSVSRASTARVIAAWTSTIGVKSSRAS